MQSNSNFPKWETWTYKDLYDKYKTFLEKDDSAGVLLTARLEYYTSWTCAMPWSSGRNFPNDDTTSFFRKLGRYLTRLLGDEAYNVYKDVTETNQVKERDILIFAVIINSKDDVTYLLTEEKGGVKHSIYAVLFASAMFKALSKQADGEGNNELGTSFKNNSRFFELLACDGIAQMYLEDRAGSQKLLVQPVDGYGFSMKTVMKFSANHRLMQFMGTTACQTKLNSLWTQKLARFTSTEMIIACILLPFLIPCIKFVAHKDERKKKDWSPFSTINLFGFTNNAKNKLSLAYAVYFFHNTPVTKFWTNLIAYFVMLCCFSFFVLTDLHHFSDGKMSSMEKFVLFWTSTILLEEIRQILQREHISLWYKIRSWWRDHWNKFDAIMYAMYALSVTLRVLLPQEDFEWARMTYSITLATFILRTLHFFYVAKITGPKIIMIGKMVTDLKFFVIIYAVVLVSFGIIMQANLYPNSEPKLELFKNVVYLPYWQMYGELFLETIEGQETTSCTTNPSIYKTGRLSRCPESNALLPFVLAVYMALTSIMLVNLLIAMFSDTFTKIQANSVLIWKYYRYSLVYEFYERPCLVPPLVIVNHLFRIVQFMMNKWCAGKCCNIFSTDNLFEDRTLDGEIDKERSKEIEESEKKAMDETLRRYKHEKHILPLDQHSVHHLQRREVEDIVFPGEIKIEKPALESKDDDEGGISQYRPNSVRKSMPAPADLYSSAYKKYDNELTKQQTEDRSSTFKIKRKKNIVYRAPQFD